MAGVTTDSSTLHHVQLDSSVTNVMCLLLVLKL